MSGKRGSRGKRKKQNKWITRAAKTQQRHDQKIAANNAQQTYAACINCGVTILSGKRKHYCDDCLDFALRTSRLISKKRKQFA